MSAKQSINQPVVWTALVTPFNELGDVDYHALTSLVKRQDDAGNGILLLGSTGEGLALERDEQWRIVEFVCQLTPSVSLMVAVGGYNLASQLAWISQCNALPIHGYLLSSPIYAKPGAVGQKHWFNALLDQAQHPCMIYNVPSRSGVALVASALAELAQHPNFWAIKEASGNIDSFLAFRDACPSIQIFSGEDGLMPELANIGAQGLVSVCANAWPEATRLYVEKSLAGEHDSLFPVWKEAIATLFSVANPIPVKVLMHHQQQTNSPVLRAPLTHQELVNQQSLVQADLNVNEWLSCSQ